MKLPSFQFYPGDWRKDPGVQSLNFHDRGVWFEILCLLHESTDRGKLLLNGQAMPDDALARLLGLDKQVLTSTLLTLLTYGVASRDEQSGALTNRRMVRDEGIRKVRSECGKMGGNPALLNHSDKQKETTQLKVNPTPSVAASPSTSTSETATAPLPPRLPTSAAEAISWTAGAGVPESFAKEVFLEHEGTAWTFAGKPVTNWKSYVSSRWMKVKSIQSERQKYMTAPKRTFQHRESAVSRPQAVPTWMAVVEEIRRLLVDPGANGTRLAQLGESLPGDGWDFLDGITEQNPVKAAMKAQKLAETTGSSS